MAHVSPLRRRVFRATRTTQSLLVLLASMATACTNASEPGGWASSIVLRSDVPTGMLRSREDVRVLIGERLRDPIVVQALNAPGRPAAWVEVTATASHGGSVVAAGGAGDSSSSTVVTGATGMAAFWWTPGPAVTFQTLTFSAPGAEDFVVPVYVYWPISAKVNVIIADSVLSVGETTTAYATFATPTGEPITYDGKVYWQSNERRIAVVSGGDSTSADGRRTVTNGQSAITITAVSPGRPSLFAEVTVARSVGSQSGIVGSKTITVHPICALTKATPLTPGQSVNGLMTAQDCRLETGAPYDHYRLDVAVGQRVQVDLASARFDPYLILLDADGNWVTGDDWSGGGTSARITFTAEAATYYLQATSLAPGVTGDYTLAAHVVP